MSGFFVSECARLLRCFLTSLPNVCLRSSKQDCMASNHLSPGGIHDHPFLNQVQGASDCWKLSLKNENLFRRTCLTSELYRYGMNMPSCSFSFSPVACRMGKVSARRGSLILVTAFTRSKVSFPFPASAVARWVPSLAACTLPCQDSPHDHYSTEQCCLTPGEGSHEQCRLDRPLNR